jgi:mannose-6-phosphate isomerase-like protein (cupin superfamily)
MKERLRVDAAQAALAALKDKTFVELFRHGSLTIEIYKPIGVDRQKPHTRDEVYVVISGSGVFLNGGERRPFEAGEVLFVPAHAEHRFEEFSEDFSTWVFFYGPEGGETV